MAFFDFNFGLPNFTGSQNDPLSAERLLKEGLPVISKALTRVILNRSGRRNQGTLIRELGGVFLNQGVGGRNAPSRPFFNPPVSPDAQQQNRYFRASQGQMLAQMAAAISRAGRRYL